MNYQHMTIAELLKTWDEASADLQPGTNWMHHRGAHRRVEACLAELRIRGFFDKILMRAAMNAQSFIERD